MDPIFAINNEFGAEEATMVGGIMGFAEESIREEDKIFDEEDIIRNIDIDKMPFDIRAFAISNPNKFEHLLSICLKHAKTRRDERINMLQLEQDIENNRDELEAMNNCERKYED